MPWGRLIQSATQMREWSVAYPNDTYKQVLKTETQYGGTGAKTVTATYPEPIRSIFLRALSRGKCGSRCRDGRVRWRGAGGRFGAGGGGRGKSALIAMAAVSILAVSEAVLATTASMLEMSRMVLSLTDCVLKATAAIGAQAGLAASVATGVVKLAASATNPTDCFRSLHAP